jgi:hypothetical protein
VRTEAGLRRDLAAAAVALAVEVVRPALAGRVERDALAVLDAVPRELERDAVVDLLVAGRAKWDAHYTSLDRGYWVHNAEHGGVILLYRCPEGCPDVVDALLDVARALAPDGSCQAPVRNRVLVVADPLLPPDVQVAAVGWNATYTASCFDAYVGTFADDRYNRGPEDTCLDGASLGSAPL